METMPYLIFKDKSSLDFGLFITEKGSYKGAQRDITYTSVAGRSGDLITDNGRYKNIKVPYKLSLLNTTEREFSDIAHQIKGWLLAEQGYFKLWDSYDKNYYRLASYSEEVDIEQELRALGSLSVSFNCKPFKYSFEGQKIITLTAAGSIYNAEFYPSKPYIKVVGSGTITLTINNTSFTLTSVNEYIELDFETLNAYKGTTAQNGKVSGADMSTFSFIPGYNSISWVGSVTRFEIVPRWCSL